MLRVLGRAPSGLARSEADPWIPLKVFWEVRRPGVSLDLHITGRSGGFVEMRVDSESGALHELVGITLPPVTRRTLQEAPVVEDMASPVLDRELWPWKVTPDYKEPERTNIDMSGELSVSTVEGDVVLWFSDLPVHGYIACGEVKVGCSSTSDLVCIVAPDPPIVEPEILS
ncbi:hypothetical protein [Saccharomonospora cyanea]|uniref:Uncharacterized protein n=1 Tax=Saccharomonospora cyanea NA-134 TaxID=882082 RepID=H5XFG9_9PSEU|nr:hypothetical protein [Saccharomonospora cyanea]EHR62592.1 hypothetical protein SaccyDRAFT_3765 [Saccharomonospora cyanea NA-134]